MRKIHSRVFRIEVQCPKEKGSCHLTRDLPLLHKIGLYSQADETANWAKALCLNGGEVSIQKINCTRRGCRRRIVVSAQNGKVIESTNTRYKAYSWSEIKKRKY